MRDPMKYEGRDLPDLSSAYTDEDATRQGPDHGYDPVRNAIEIVVGTALIFVMAMVFIGSALWAIHKAVVFAQGVFIR